MSEQIKPALTPEEWANKTGPAIDGELVVEGDDLRVREPDFQTWTTYTLRPEQRHAIGARCLRGQPFGFTWDDVDGLRQVAEQLPTFGAGPGGTDVPDPELTSLADRIAALLPPREPPA